MSTENDLNTELIKMEELEEKSERLEGDQLDQTGGELEVILFHGGRQCSIYKCNKISNVNILRNGVSRENNVLWKCDKYSPKSEEFATSINRCWGCNNLICK